MTLPARRLLRGLLALPLLAAFALTGSPGALASESPPDLERQVTVMTRNLYLGADLTRVLTNADPGTGLAQIAGIVELSRPDLRMAAVAREIAAAKPDVVALQEVADWNIRGLVPGTSIQAVPPARYDFLALLQKALVALHEPYRVLVSQTNFDSAAQLPAPVAQLATFADRDVILARGAVGAVDTVAAHYDAQLRIPIPLLGATVDFQRGYEWADVRTRGALWRIVNTHPEAYSPAELGLGTGDINGAEVTELREALAGSTLPTVVLGDLNSAVGDTVHAGYSVLIGAGFSDTWLTLGKNGDDFTCCRNEFLVGGDLYTRIDHVLSKGPITPVAATRVGVAMVAMTDPLGPPLWPSDHAGVVTTLTVPLQ